MTKLDTQETQICVKEKYFIWIKFQLDLIMIPMKNAQHFVTLSKHTD